MQKLIKTFFLSCILLQVAAIFAFSNAFINPPLAFAWDTNQSAEAECVLNTNENVNYAKIRVRFTNKDNSRAMNVVATDNQTGKTIDFPTIQPGQTDTRSIQTREKNIGNGTVTLALVWASGASGTDKATVSYNALNCPQPTSPTPTPTSAPVVPTSTPIPTVAQVVNNNNSQSNATVTNNVVVQQVEQAQQVQVAAPKPQVLAAVKMKELPKTGTQDNILFGLFSLIPAGLLMIKKSQKMLQG